MNNAERYHFADFTRANYTRLLGLAARSYIFRTFTTYRPGERFVLWRHDVDFSPQAALKLAQREADAAVRATYFIWLHSDFYNLLETAVTDCVRAIVGLGHAIGLHFDLAYHDVQSEADLARWLEWEKRILDDLFETSCEVFSFHNPNEHSAAYRKPAYAGLINAAGQYFYDEVGFCSDSNGYWRTRRLEDVLTQGSDPRLQVLTHAEMWQDDIMSPRQRVFRCIEGRAQNTRERYDRLISERHRASIDWT